MMAGEIGDCGFLKIEGADKRTMVASVLFENGYTVSTVRRKRNGKTYEYFVKYEMKSKEMEET